MPNRTLNIMRDKITQNIKRYGWTATDVFGTAEHPSPIFTYTTGLTDRGWPELIVFGVPGPVGHGIISMVIEKNKKPEDGDRFEFNGYPVVLRTVPSNLTCANYAVQTASYYQRDVDMMQIVLSDRDKRLPWEPGCQASSQSAIVDWSREIRN